MVGVLASSSADGGALAAFCIDTTEVTAEDYATCLKAGVCPPRNESCVEGLLNDEGRFPARCMSGDDAAVYCTWKGKRLPSEAEWRRAACGDDGRVYPWGNEEPTTQLCWMGAPGGFHGTTQRGPCRVGSFPAGRSPSGMLDAAGNVDEFVAKPEGQREHVVRGGSYNESFLTMRCTARLLDSNSNPSRGFRCAASPP